MKVLLNPIGSIGDVNPYLGLGEALQRRGHRVTVLTNPYFETLVRSVGLDFVPIGASEELRAFHRRRDLWNFATGWRAALRWGALGTMRQTYAEVRRLYEPGDTVAAGPGMAFGFRIAQETLGLPLATIHLEPDKLPTAFESPVWPPPMVMNRLVPRPLKRFQLWIARRYVIDGVVAPELNAWRRELGLSPVRSIVGGWWNSPDRVLGLFPAWFCRPQPDWPANTTLTGFPLWDQSSLQDLPDVLRRFLDEGAPPIVFTSGTNNEFADEFFDKAVEICRVLSCRGVLLGRYEKQLVRDVVAVPYAPLLQVLPRSAAMVHHGGIGTSGLALAAGTPQLVRPSTFSQPDTALRLQRLGVAKVLAPRRFTVERAAGYLSNLLSCPATRQRCRTFRDRVAGDDAYDAVCDALECLPPAAGNGVRSLIGA